VQLHRARDKFQAAGLRLVLIGQGTPRDATSFRRQFGIELPLLADERRASYKAMGMKMGSVADLIGPRVVAKGVLASARNRVVQGRPVGNVAQLAGSIVVGPHGRIIWAHRSHDASDNASPEQLLEAITGDAAG
jgi:AhpC/TSA antioxidant enzyme